MKKVITINIGNKGAILSVLGSNKIFDTFFLETFSQETLPQVLEFFKRHKGLDAIILLDTVAQNYNYKIFPALSYFDLQDMVNRKFITEIPKNDLKQKKLLYKNKLDKRSVYLFVSASTDSPLKEWLNFFNIVPNNLIGIYMVPLEAEEIAKKVMITNGMKDTLNKKNSWILILFNNRASDLRQVAVFNGHIAFTRLISFDSTKEDLIEFTKTDIIRTSEYIKRFDTDFNLDKLVIITVLDQQSKITLRELKMEKTLFLNYTPSELSRIIKVGAGYINKDEKYSDLLISMFALQNKHNIKFGNQKINITNTLTKTLLAVKSLIFVLILAIVGSFAFNIITSSSSNKTLQDLTNELERNNKILKSKTKNNLDVNSDEVNQIIEAGLLKDILDAKYINPVDTFQKFAKAQNGNALTFNLRWYIEDFDYQDTNGIKSAKSLYDISIINPEGTASKLFNKYDMVNLKLKDTFKDQMTGITSLPNNINFSQKYLTYPIKVEIVERGQTLKNNNQNKYIDNMLNNKNRNNYNNSNYNLEDGVIYE